MVRDHNQACALANANRIVQFIAKLPVEIELCAEDGFLAAVRSDEAVSHILASKVHVRHHPHELSVLTEFQFSTCFPVGCSRRNTLPGICERLRRECDV